MEKHLQLPLEYLRRCVARDGGAEFSADEAAALLAALEAATPTPAPLADAELDELASSSKWLAQEFELHGEPAKLLDVIRGSVETAFTASEDPQSLHQCFQELRRWLVKASDTANALPGLLARLAAAETELAQYKPAPLPTGWVLRGEMDPEEELRCEIELHHHGEGQPPLYATYWEGREGDFATWTDEQGNWYHDNEVARYRYAPAPTVKGGPQDA